MRWFHVEPVDVALPFIFSVTVGAGQSFQLPTVNTGTYDSVIDWGDGNSDVLTVWNATERTHTFSLAGTYDISISGVFNGWVVNSYADRLKISEVKQWGGLRLGTGALAFYRCSNLVITATDILDTSACTSFLAAFRECTSLTDIPSISQWDTSNIVNMTSCFWGCASLNPDVGNWDVSNVLTFSTAANNGMFQGCTLFNRDLNNWNVSSATITSNMFYGCSNFNGDVSSWDVSNVENFARMFSDCTSFNQDVSNWNTSSAVNMQFMFFNCASFNADISGWDVSNVTNMGWMLRNTDIDQNLSGWNITALTTAQNMFLLSTLSTTNYDALLIGWAAQAVQSGVLFHGGNSKYTPGGAAEAARDTLIDTYGWTISDGGSV